MRILTGTLRLGWIIVIAATGAAVVAAQATQPPAGRGGGAAPRAPAPLVLDDHVGFDAIFDGASLQGWDGDPAFWRVEQGAIVGESTRDRPLAQNTFLIWRGGEPDDFELKCEYRITATNSGIQFRSVQVPSDAQTGRWVLKGYQADIDYANQFTGQIYEERGRGFLAMRGQAVHVAAGGRPQVVGTLQRSADELKAVIHRDDWNQVHIIARGNVITQILNGAVTSIVVDDDAAGRRMNGLIGLQLHVGDPMRVEFRNIWLKPQSK
jgi:3-keto-disaccharide hydrolase